MAIDEGLSARVRAALESHGTVRERQMFGVRCFMLDEKMCACVGADSVMFRVGPDAAARLAAEPGSWPMVHGGREMKGFIRVDTNVLDGEKAMSAWLKPAIEFSRSALPSKSAKSAKSRGPSKGAKP